MSASNTCIARVAVWASECGFCPPEEYYTVAIQCHRSSDTEGDNDCLCKIHNKNLPFGIFGKKAPQETLTKCSIGKGDTKFNFKEGEKMCYLFNKPDGVGVGDKFTLVAESDELDNAFWKTEDYTDYGNEDEDDDEDESSDDDEYEDCHETLPEECEDYNRCAEHAAEDDADCDFKGIPVADMRSRCDSNDIKHDGLSKSEIRQALVDHANA